MLYYSEMYYNAIAGAASAVGGILGFALVFGGGSAVQWATPKPGSFPPYGGVVPIICAWFISPILTGAAAALLFFILRTAVLRANNAYFRSFWALPPAVFVTFFINVFFVLTKVLAPSNYPRPLIPPCMLFIAFFSRLYY